jgi:hypothetical protein
MAEMSFVAKTECCLAATRNPKQHGDPLKGPGPTAAMGFYAVGIDQ